MLVIGLTGGIASGKTTVSNLFRKLGISIIDADVIARSLMQPGTAVFARVVEQFGSTIVTEDGTLDRKKLADMVFRDADKRRALEAIVHPPVRAEIEQQVAQAQGPYCIAAIPLLLEVNMTDLVDRILVIDVPEQVQITRLCERDGIDPEQARQILAAQVSRSQRLAQATEVIENQDDLSALERSVQDLHRHYCQLAAGSS